MRIFGDALVSIRASVNRASRAFLFFILERLSTTFTANGKRQEWPRDHVYPSFAARCFQFLRKIECFCVRIKGQNYLVLFSSTYSYFQVIYQTRDTVFHHISNTEKRVENTTRSGVFLTNFEVFDMKLWRVFDTTSQTNLFWRRN